MSENNELFKGVPTPKSAATASTDTGSVKKVEAEADDTRTRKTVKLSAAGMMPNLNNPVGRLKPEDLAVPPREVPPAAATEKPADSPTLRLRPQSPMPKVPGAAPASTDTGSVKKVDAEADDTRTRRTVRISAASVERRPGGMPMPSAGVPTPPPAAPAAPENKPKLTMPTPAPKPTISAPKPAAPAPAPAAASAPAAPAEKPAEAEAPAAEAGGRRGRKKSGGLNLVKDEAAKAGPSRVANDMAQISGKSAGSSEASPVYTVLAIITVLALIGTLVLSSQYLNVWSPEWAAGFTLLK